MQKAKEYLENTADDLYDEASSIAEFDSQPLKLLYGRYAACYLNDTTVDKALHIAYLEGLMFAVNKQNVRIDDISHSYPQIEERLKKLLDE